jgi:hypothetical protein
MGWFSKKKVEKEVEIKHEIAAMEAGVDVSRKKDTNDNLIYRGPMSGMSEAIKKFNETGEKIGDVRE